MTEKTPTFEELMESALATFRDRRSSYGNSIDKFGEVMHALFPQGLGIDGPQQWAWLGLMVQVVHKLTRYSNSYYDQSSHDSIHDLGVYAFLLQELDRKTSAEDRERRGGQA
jgi:hypothetical protein